MEVEGSMSSENCHATIPVSEPDFNTTGSYLKSSCEGDYCIFCMKKVSADKSLKIPTQINDNGREKTVPKAVVAPKFLSTLNLMWRYLCSYNEKEGNNNQEINFDDVMMGGQKSSETLVEESATFSEVPTLCQPCADEVKQLETLMEAVRAQVEVLRRVIAESRSDGRNFLRDTTRPTAATESGVPSPTPADVPRFPRSSIKRDRVGARQNLQNDETCSSQLGSVKTEIQSDTEDNDDDMDWVMENFDAHASTESDDDDNSVDNVKSEKEDESDSDESWCMEDEEDPGTPVAMDGCDNNEAMEVNPLDDNKSTSATEKRKRGRKRKNIERRDPTGDLQSSKKFKCPECSFSFCTQSGLSTHQKNTHPEIYAPFRCSCGDRFMKKLHMRDHILTSKKHAGEEKLKRGTVQTCDMCGVQVPFKDILDHVRTHVGDYAIKCPNDSCQYAFSSSLLLRSHIIKKCKTAAPAGKLEYACETCGFKTDQRLSLRSHISQFHEREPEKPFSCPLTGCDKVFCTRQSVDFHLSSHNLKPVTTQKCDHCSKMIDVNKMPDHLKDQHEAKQIFTCQQCLMAFSERESLIQHFYVHRFTGMFCDICNDGVKYSRHAELVEHYAVSHQIEGRRVACTFCLKKFLNQNWLKTHITRRHNLDLPEPATSSETKDSISFTSSEKKSRLSKSQKKYPCELCFGSVAFATMTSLVSHKIRIHGEEPFRCQICDATFNTNKDLSRHEKQHAGIMFQTEFKCEVINCGKIFTHKKQLTRHTSLAHLNGKIHKCDLCEKSYYEIHALKSHHETVHLRLRPYICDTCGESFATSQVLKRHNLIHTGERPFACELCGQAFRHREVLKNTRKVIETKGIILSRTDR